jgi:hypothetical protein
MEMARIVKAMLFRRFLAALHRRLRRADRVPEYHRPKVFHSMFDPSVPKRTSWLRPHPPDLRRRLY